MSHTVTGHPRVMKLSNVTDVNKAVNPLHFGSILAIQESGSNLESLIGAVNCWRMKSEYYLVFSSEKGGGTRFSPCLSLCLSVCYQDYSKTHAWIWMKCCALTDVGT